MAELILTAKEKKMPLFADFDDESFGKLIKANMANLLNISKELDRVFVMSAAMVLCNVAHEANADTLKVSMDGMKNKGNDFGNWQVTIKKVVK